MQISIVNVQQRKDPYQLFLDSFKIKETGRKYNNWLYHFLKLVPDQLYQEILGEKPNCQQVGTLAKCFVELARKNTSLAQNIIAEFKKMLTEKNIKYKQDNFLLITGMMLPMGVPIIDYCGHVLSDDNEDYWFSSSYHDDSLTSYDIHDENPSPCIVGDYSCGCSLQTQLEEKNLKELSYFDESQETRVGKIFQDYLNEGYKVVNVPDSFVVGKNNLEIAPDITSFCGQFKGKYHEWYFLGNINGSKVVNWSLELDKKPKLCAINENSTAYHFKITKPE